MTEQTKNATPIVAAVPGLLGFLSDDQRAVLFALAGMDQGAPRTLEETVKVLGQDAEALFYQQALINRALLQGLITPDPQALRLRALLISDGGLTEALHAPGIYSIQGLIPALRAPQFPVVRTLAVVALWAGGQVGQAYPTGLRVLGPEGTELLRDELTLEPQGVGAFYAQEYRIRLEFPQPGRYTFQVWLIGGPLYTDYLPVYSTPTEGAHGPA